MSARENRHNLPLRPVLVIPVVLLLAMILFPRTLHAQSFQEARDLAYSGQRQKAKQICLQMIAGEFDSDVAVLLGRIYAWDGKYDSTRVYISEVLKRYPTHWDALDAMSDVQYWDEKYQEAIRYCDIALEKDPKDEHFMYKRAVVLNALGSYDQSVKQLEVLLKQNPANAEARTKLEAIRLNQMKNVVRVAYYFDYFDSDPVRDPWNLVAVSYGRKTPIGKIIARVNLADRFTKQGAQYEVDAYPDISEKNYAYLNFGYSDASFFPTYRYGAELYHSFPLAFEGSIGMRALYFSEPVYMITGSVGKYTGNYWFSARTYVIPSSSGVSASGSIQVRRYFTDPENYIGLRIGYGLSPETRTYGVLLSASQLLNSQTARFEYNHIFKKVWTTNLGVAFARDQTFSSGPILDYSFDIGIGRFF